MCCSHTSYSHAGSHGRTWPGLLIVTGICLLTGCAETESTTEAKPSVLKPKNTQDIGEFDPNANTEVVNPDVKISNPITGAAEAYLPLRQQVTMLPVTQAIQLFQATEGRYPKDHAEFMQRIIKENRIPLPELPAGQRYEYDVANHQLLVVRDKQPAN